MEHYNYEFSSSIINSETNPVNNVIWTIYNLRNVIYSSNTEKIVIKSDKNKNYPQGTPEFLKMELMLVKSDVVEFWFRAPISMYVRVDLYNKNLNYIIACRADRVLANKWQLLTMRLIDTFKINLNNNLSSGFSEYELKYQFSIVHNAGGKTYDSDVSMTDLTLALQNLLKTSTLTDVTIFSHDGIQIPAHKAILAARSAVFKALFDHGTKETITNAVESPFEESILRKVLLYMYTDQFHKTESQDDDSEKMLEAADFYLLDGLKSKCEELLYRNLTIDNAIGTLMLADKYLALNLKKLTLQYINDGRMEKIIQTDDYKLLQSPQLIKSIFEFSYNNK